MEGRGKKVARRWKVLDPEGITGCWQEGGSSKLEAGRKKLEGFFGS